MRFKKTRGADRHNSRGISLIHISFECTLHFLQNCWFVIDTTEDT